MVTLHLVDIDVLRHRLLDDAEHFRDMDLKDIIDMMPRLSVRVPDNFSRVSFEYRDYNLGQATDD